MIYINPITGITAGTAGRKIYLIPPVTRGPSLSPVYDSTSSKVSLNSLLLRFFIIRPAPAKVIIHKSTLIAMVRIRTRIRCLKSAIVFVPGFLTMSDDIKAIIPPYRNLRDTMPHTRPSDTGIAKAR
jgi:hypothetical protein